MADMDRKDDCTDCKNSMVDYRTFLGFGCQRDEVTFSEHGGFIIIENTEYMLDNCPLWEQDDICEYRGNCDVICTPQMKATCEKVDAAKGKAPRE